MAKKLKTYQTSLGFFDLAIAVPSMKAALEAWGAKSNLFHQGFAKEAEDPDIIAATMASPGVILRRPVGSEAKFREDAEVPDHLPANGTPRPKRGKPTGAKVSDASARKAAVRYQKDQAKRERQRLREEAAAARRRERREAAVANAEAAIADARQDHERKQGAIDAERSILEKRSEAEDERWTKLKQKLQAALRRARAL